MSTIQLQFYISCTILTTLSFAYLIYNIIVTKRKSYSINAIPSLDPQHFMNDNINEIIANSPYDFYEENYSDNQAITTNTKKIINSRKYRHNNSTYNHHCRQFSNTSILLHTDFLPNSHIGLIQMKLLNKQFIKNTAKTNSNASLIRQKKRKTLCNYVKKYGFCKTSLVTIYEELEY